MPKNDAVTELQTSIEESAIADDGEAVVAPDGRRAWRDRNRLAVVDALLDLYAEGNLRPDAQEVAERSGVSKRSVFRYFEDRDDLDRAAIHRQQHRVRHLIVLPGIGQGPLESRIHAIARQRVELFREVHPAALVSRIRAPFHGVIAEELEQSRRFFTRQVERQFAPELSAMDEPRRTETLAAADALCSFETYHLLSGRGHEAGVIQAAVRRGLGGLFGD